MYKVFLNEKIIIPGLECPRQFDGLSLSLSANFGSANLLPFLKLLTDAPGPARLVIGKPGEHEIAWASLQRALRPEHASGGFVLNSRQKLLMIHRKGYWDLPKGKPFAGETSEQTAMREVEEETGIGSLKIQSLLGTTWHIIQRSKEWYLKENTWYLMYTSSKAKPQPQTEESIRLARWTGPKEYQKIKAEIFPSLIELADLGWEVSKTSR